MGKKAATDAIMTQAVSPAPNQRTNNGRKDRSGNAPKIMTSGVIVTSNGFLLPAMKAVGKATEKASISPQSKFRKL